LLVGALNPVNHIVISGLSAEEDVKKKIRNRLTQYRKGRRKRKLKTALPAARELMILTL